MQHFYYNTVSLRNQNQMWGLILHTITESAQLQDIFYPKQGARS